MNVSPFLQKTILSVIILAVLGYVIFNTFTGEIPADEFSFNNQVVGQDILILTDQLESVNIDKSIFSSQLFLSLVDISVPVAEETTGRANPFASIGVEAP